MSSDMGSVPDPAVITKQCGCFVHYKIIIRYWIELFFVFV